MGPNVLLTGPPRSGKTTAIRRTLDRLDATIEIGGILSPEVREDGRRIGFDVVDLATDERARLARRGLDSDTTVGSYGVDVTAVSERSRTAIAPPTDADLLVIDEIAPMQVASETFVAATTEALDSSSPVLGAIAQAPDDESFRAMNHRADVTLLPVSRKTREDLPARIAARLRPAIE